MKIRVRIKNHTTCVELQEAEPSVQQLTDVIRETLLESHGLSSQTDFNLSLNGSEFLINGSQTLASCGIVSGDLVSVMLPQPAHPPPASPAVPAGASPSWGSRSDEQLLQQPNSSVDVLMDTEDPPPTRPSAFIWEPMLCSEAEPGQAPLSLELLYHAVRSPEDALMVAAHLLMVETGFVPQCGELQPDEMPPAWKSEGGVYKLQYLHSLCEGSVVTMVAVCMGPLLVFNMMLKVGENANAVRKLSVKPHTFVTEEWPGQSAAKAFKDLRRLSRVFKDQLAYPLIVAARDAMALPTAFGLSVLPPELLLRILRLLDVRSVVRLSSTCHHFQGATADPMLWKHLYHRDFRARVLEDGNSRDTDWKTIYMNLYKAQRLSRSRSAVLPGDPGFIVAIPGIIGGAYDQRPFLPQPIFPNPRYDPIGPFAHPDSRPRQYIRRPGPSEGRPFDVRRGFI